MSDPDEDEIQILEHENAVSTTSSRTSNNSDFQGKLISDDAEIFSRQKYYKNIIFSCKQKHSATYDEDLVQSMIDSDDSRIDQTNSSTKSDKTHKAKQQPRE